MNHYKLLVMSNGVVQTIYVSSSDIVQAVYSAEVNTMEVVKIELIGSGSVLDFRPPTESA